jgi:hypothetical protein
MNQGLEYKPIQKTMHIKVTIIINMLYITIFGILVGNITVGVFRNIYYYQILQNPIDPFDPPLTWLGIILIGFYLIPILLFLISTYLLITINKLGRKVANLTSIIGIWSLFPLTLIPGAIQLYSLNYHQKSKNLFETVS